MSPKSQSQSVVYILTNPAMPGLIKIGKTTNLEQRLKSLNSTGVPLPFECYFHAAVSDIDAAERILHSLFGDERLTERREFFKTPPEKAKLALSLAVLAGNGVAPKAPDTVSRRKEVNKIISPIANPTVDCRRTFLLDKWLEARLPASLSKDMTATEYLEALLGPEDDDEYPNREVGRCHGSATDYLQALLFDDDDE